MGYEYEPLEPPHDDHPERWWFIPRITPRPAPTVPVDDATDSVCVRIARAWVPHIAGYIEGLTWSTAWTGTESERIFARNQANKLMALLMTGSDDCGGTMDCEEIMACIAPMQLQTEIEHHTEIIRLWRETPKVTDVLDAYGASGPTGVDPSATGLFRRDNSRLERYISNAAVYYAAAHWYQNGWYTTGLAYGLADAAQVGFTLLAPYNAIISEIGAFVSQLASALLVDRWQIFADAEQDPNILSDVVASAWLKGNAEPETFAGWQNFAGGTYYIDTPEKAALRDLMDAEFWTNEANFIAYLRARVVLDTLINIGDPFFARGQHWVDDELINGEYAEWKLQRGNGFDWHNVRTITGTTGLDGRPDGVSDGTDYVVVCEMVFDRPVDITGVFPVSGHDHSGGAFLNLRNVRYIELLNGPDVVATGGSLTPASQTINFPSIVRGRGNGITADRIRLTAKRAASKTNALWIEQFWVAGENFPPRNFWHGAQ